MEEPIPHQIENSYSPPVDKLLSCGDPRNEREWPNYLAMGLRPEHVPDLIRMATDEALNEADSDSLEVWAPLHAWRALGQLHAESAIEPLLGLFKRVDEQNDDWVQSDLPEAYGEIGVKALLTLSAYLADSSHGIWARCAAAESIKEIGCRYPESRGECVAALVQQLGKFTENGRTLNGMIVSFLLDLEAKEAAPIMEQAFAAGLVDESIVGDWEEVQIEFGLRDTRETPRKFATVPGWRKMSESQRERSFLKLAGVPDLKAIRKAQKKARSEAKKAKWARQLQRQRRK